MTAAARWVPGTPCPRTYVRPADADLVALLRRTAEALERLRPHVQASGDRSFLMGLELDLRGSANALEGPHATV